MPDVSPGGCHTITTKQVAQVYEPPTGGRVVNSGCFFSASVGRPRGELVSENPAL